MTKNEFKEAASYWKEKDKNSVKMESSQLKEDILEYIRANDTCALATGAGDFIRCTPIEYTYHNDAFWMFTEGGQKFNGLEQNSNVSIAIFEKFSGFGHLKGMQVSGNAIIIEPFSKEYVEAAKVRKIPLEALKKLPHVMYLIKVVPSKIEFLNSDFHEKGYDARQMLEFE